MEFQRLQKQIHRRSGARWDYVVRTSAAKKQMTSAEAIRSYQALAEVERAFRSMKTFDLKNRKKLEPTSTALPAADTAPKRAG